MAEAKMARSRAPCKPVVIVCADCGIEVLSRSSIRKRCEPCSSERRKQKNRQSDFAFTSPDDPDFKACWALTNLRPLWGDKNISKHASREFLI